MLTVTAAPASTALCTLAQVKAQLNLTDSSADSLLTALIAEATDAVTDFCNRRITGFSGGALVGGLGWGQASYTETVPGYNSNWLQVSNTPLVSVSSISYQGGVIDPTTYTIEEPQAGQIFSATPWFWTAELAIDVGWSVLARSELRQYTVTYVAGYNLPGDPVQTLPLPGSVVQATIQTVAAWYIARYRDPQLAGTTVGDMTQRYAAEDGPLPPRARQLLAPYVRYAR